MHGRAMRRSRRRVGWLALAVIAVLAAQVSATGSHLRPAAAAAQARKVLWIAMENRSYNAVIGNNAAAPYINGTLVPRGGNATNMHSESHPSLPNYVAMTTGSTQGIADDKNPAAHPLSSASLFSQVDPSWRAYQETMPAACYRRNTTFTAGTQYAVRHNPASYLVAAPISAPRADCNINDEPLGAATMGALANDLAAGQLPEFSFVTPGICHDMHAAPAGLACSPANSTTAGDQWLGQLMPQIFASPDYTSGQLVVFVTWDEGTGGAGIRGMDCLSEQYLSDAGCHIPTLVFSTSVTPGASDGTFFSHYSILKTTEELLGQPTTDLGSNVSDANSMLSAFSL
ncbi:MAG: hypothetical protein DLM56_01685 [Pseudonocardiales bacterium]|nr:MAG: hypothetical protein DLM56_01685 [Pseudonocardiales bacterium]